MQHALQPYVTAGVAAVGASLIAATPVAAPLPDIGTVRDVALTADGSPLGDFLSPWIDQYNTAADNATQLLNNFYLAPGVALQQFFANQADFAQQILTDPLNSNEVAQQMQANLQAVLTGFTLLNADQTTTNIAASHTVDDLHSFLPLILPGYFPVDQQEAVTSLVNFLISPLSGIIIGELGPVLSPVVALINSINDGDGLNEILANMVGSVFNGATIDLDSLLPAIAQSGLLPAGTSIDHLNFAFGGLLSPGDVKVGPYELFDGSGDTVASIPAVGGSIANSLGGSIAGFTFDSHPVGPIGAWEGWGQAIGALLGSGWAGQGPVGVFPPLTGASFPVIPGDFFGDGEAGGAAAESASLWQDVLAALGG